MHRPSFNQPDIIRLRVFPSAHSSPNTSIYILERGIKFGWLINKQNLTN